MRLKPGVWPVLCSSAITAVGAAVMLWDGDLVGAGLLGAATAVLLLIARGNWRL